MELVGDAMFIINSKQRWFRYLVAVDGSQMKIWLEDRESKMQWQVNELTLTEIERDGKSIPHATMDHYATHFANRLGESGRQGNGGSSLSKPYEDGSRQLWIELVLVVNGVDYAFKPVYSFRLASIPLDRVAFVEAKYRDIEEDVAALKKSVKQPAAYTLDQDDFIEASTTEAGERMPWKIGPNSSKVSTGLHADSKMILVRRSGVFQLQICVIISKEEGMVQFAVIVNDKDIQTCRGQVGGLFGPCISSTLVCALNDGDEVAVENFGPSVITSCTFEIIRLM